MLKPILLNNSILRWYSSRTKFNKKVPNPGVQKQLNIFKDNNPDIDTLKIEESMFDEYENDFMGSHKFHELYESESKKLKRMIKYKRIERMYFGTPKNPNLLTWSEKEQIRFLSNSNPAQWTPEKIAESFPTTVEIVKKLIKSQWKLRNIEQIKKHDKKVSENWKAIDRGELTLPIQLNEHIKNFISRKESIKLTNFPVKDSSLRPTCEEAPSSSEFVNIIKSYKKKLVLEESSSTSDIKTKAILPDSPQETYVLQEEQPVHLNKKYYTLEALRKEVGSLKSEQELSVSDQHFLKENTNANRLAEPSSGNHFSSELIPLSDEFGTYKKNSIYKTCQIKDEIVQKIIIPEEKKKDDCIYKVKDCYYNKDGEFLYRVPGMT